MEGESSQVEMKLSSDMDEEEGNGVGDHLNHNGGSRDPYVVRKTSRTPKNLCFLLTTTLIIFIIGKEQRESGGMRNEKAGIGSI